MWISKIKSLQSSHQGRVFGYGKSQLKMAVFNDMLLREVSIASSHQPVAKGNIWSQFYHKDVRSWNLLNILRRLFQQLKQLWTRWFRGFFWAFVCFRFVQRRKLPMIHSSYGCSTVPKTHLILRPLRSANLGFLIICDYIFTLSIYLRSTPHPVTVTTRIITFLVGNPYKPSFATVTGWGVDPIYTVYKMKVISTATAGSACHMAS